MFVCSEASLLSRSLSIHRSVFSYVPPAVTVSLRWRALHYCGNVAQVCSVDKRLSIRRHPITLVQSSTLSLRPFHSLFYDDTSPLLLILLHVKQVFYEPQVTFGRRIMCFILQYNSRFTSCISIAFYDLSSYAW